ncbi:MAG: hypothetical protein ABIJ21_00025 [Nanoarchaeota archaeon]
MKCGNCGYELNVKTKRLRIKCPSCNNSVLTSYDPEDYNLEPASSPVWKKGGAV